MTLSALFLRDAEILIVVPSVLLPNVEVLRTEGMVWEIGSTESFSYNVVVYVCSRTFLLTSCYRFVRWQKA